MFTVLLTDGEFTGLIRTLRAGYGTQIRIVGLSQNIYIPHQKMLDAFYPVPSHDAPDYFPRLKEILKKENVSYIFPIISEGLESIAQMSGEIHTDTGAKVISPSLSALKVANDKGSLYAYLRELPNLKTLVPDFFVAHTKEELFDEISQLERCGKTACIKRRRGEDAGGFWKIDEGEDYANRLFFSPVERVLSKELLAAAMKKWSSQTAIPPYLVCEYLPGEEWDCDILAYEGELRCLTTRINLKMTGGLTSVLEVRDNPELSSHCRELVRALHLSYVSCISFRKDRGGEFRLLEINPRMMGNIYVSCLCGNNYPQMSIDLLEGREIFPQKPLTGIRTAMYYDQAVISDPDEIRMKEMEPQYDE